MTNSNLSHKIRVGIIVGSTRIGRRGPAVAEWVADVASQHRAVTADEATFEVVDLAEYGLPLLDEPVPAIMGDYRNPHTTKWAQTISSFDGFVFVTPEYNHGVSAALKNAIDFLFAEWNNKAAGFVSYGLHGGTRAVEHLRATMAELQIADVRTHVVLPVFTEWDFSSADMSDPTASGVFAPSEHQQPELTTMLDEILAWSRALKPLRETTASPAAAHNTTDNPDLFASTTAVSQ